VISVRKSSLVSTAICLLCSLLGGYYLVLRHATRHDKPSIMTRGGQDSGHSQDASQTACDRGCRRRGTGVEKSRLSTQGTWSKYLRSYITYRILLLLLPTYLTHGGRIVSGAYRFKRQEFPRLQSVIQSVARSLPSLLPPHLVQALVCLNPGHM
jgi:hypothetical protein